MAKTVQGRSHKMDITQDWEKRTYTVSCSDCGKVLFNPLVKDYVRPLRILYEADLEYLEELGCDLEGLHQRTCEE
jgi:hypothetical protein